jgi:hypothetical protein
LVEGECLVGSASPLLPARVLEHLVAQENDCELQVKLRVLRHLVRVTDRIPSE